MANRIVYNSDILRKAESDLSEIMEALKSVQNGLSAIDMSEEWWSRLNIRGSSAASRLGVEKSNLKVNARYAESVKHASERMRSTFDDTQRQVSGNADSISTGWAEKYGAGTGATAVVSKESKPAITTWDEAIRKLIGGGGYIGKIVSQAHDIGVGIKNKDWAKVGKATGKVLFDVVCPWAEKVIKGKYNPRDLIGKATKTFEEGIANKWLWISSLVTSGIDNYQEWQSKGGDKDDIDRYTYEWGVETATNVAISAGATAVVSAVVATAGLPAIGTAVVVGVGSAALVYAGDCACKWATEVLFDERMNMAQAVGHVAGEIYDFKEKVYKAAGKAVKRGAERLKARWDEAVSNVWNWAGSW